MSSDKMIRSIADFRRLRAILAELYNGIDRARREFGDEVIVQHAKLENVSDALARSERVTDYLRKLQQQVLEKRRNTFGTPREKPPESTPEGGISR